MKRIKISNILYTYIIKQILKFVKCYNSNIYKLWKGYNMANKVRTSKTVAKKASKQLRSNTTSKIQKSVAASALRNRAKK